VAVSDPDAHAERALADLVAPVDRRSEPDVYDRRARLDALVMVLSLPGSAERTAAELCVFAHYLRTGTILDTPTDRAVCGTYAPDEAHGASLTRILGG
jgi:hypothetical protein